MYAIFQKLLGFQFLLKTDHVDDIQCLSKIHQEMIKNMAPYYFPFFELLVIIF